MGNEILYSISHAPMSIFSKHSPPTRLGIFHSPEHDFFDDPSLFLPLDDEDGEEVGSILPQDSSFLPSDDRLHLETAERERLKSMCITFRANPFAFQEINQNGLGRRTTGPPAQPHASPPLLYNFWADSSASPPPTLAHTSCRTRSHAHSPPATSPPPSPLALPPTVTTPRTPSHDQRPRRDQHPFRPPPRTPQRRHRAQPDPPTRTHPRHALVVKCEEQEPENPLSHPYYPLLQKSPTEWYRLPSSSSAMTSNLQPATLSYGEPPSRPQNDQINSYTGWSPHQAPSARAVHSHPYTPTSSFAPHHPPPMHAYIPISSASTSTSSGSGSGSFSPRHLSDDISSTARAVRDSSQSNDRSIIPQSFTEQALHHHHDHSWPRFSSHPPFAISDSIDPISPHSHQQQHHPQYYHHQHHQHRFPVTSINSRRESYQPLQQAYPASPSDSSPSDSPPSRSLIVSALTDLDLYPSSSASAPNLDDDGMHMNIMQRVP